MWLAALSAAYAMKTGAHFALRFLVDRTPPKVQRWIGAVVALSSAAFLAVFAYQALRFTIEVHDMLAPATRMSMAIPYSSPTAATRWALTSWSTAPTHRPSGATSTPTAATPQPATRACSSASAMARTPASATSKSAGRTARWSVGRMCALASTRRCFRAPER